MAQEYQPGKNRWCRGIGLVTKSEQVHARTDTFVRPSLQGFRLSFRSRAKFYATRNPLSCSRWCCRQVERWPTQALFWLDWGSSALNPILDKNMGNMGTHGWSAPHPSVPGFQGIDKLHSYFTELSKTDSNRFQQRSLNHANPFQQCGSSFGQDFVSVFCFLQEPDGAQNAEQFKPKCCRETQAKNR